MIIHQKSAFLNQFFTCHYHFCPDIHPVTFHPLHPLHPPIAPPKIRKWELARKNFTKTLPFPNAGIRKPLILLGLRTANVQKCHAKNHFRFHTLKKYKSTFAFESLSTSLSASIRNPSVRCSFTHSFTHYHLKVLQQTSFLRNRSIIRVKPLFKPSKES